ncbi:cytochrome c oxidase subunit II [Pseudogemmobacter humi]|uniref:Cytochrome c oxidase subunit 2 n=1 Tax=Pseudogemmobacter humi TaxID=2483812 RepID=A0A3P5XIE6_9RHOB|nr:cytochrome c oxidase subunit II [Pseudogemmobacter humi]VDC28310.1 Cytochrome c oxidase subunit 2 precursor [Pseudogemmobacter humi]
MRVMTYLKGAALAGLVAVASGSAMAQALEIVGQPEPKGIHFQPAATDLAVGQHWLDDMVLYIITAITIFVLLMILIVILRFNSRANPVPRKFTHNTPLEIAWTVIPILVLIVIGAFSIPELQKQQTFPEGEVVIKITGNQWYWNYEYPQVVDEGGSALSFDSYMIGGLNWGGDATLTPEAEKGLIDAGYTRDQFLLAVDNAMVVPRGAKVLLQITAADVIHSWTIPAFAVKQDAVPGRLALAWFAADREGIYFGQCSELCGKDHAFMPITVKVVSPEVYQAWTQDALAGNVALTADAAAVAPAAVDLAAND